MTIERFTTGDFIARLRFDPDLVEMAVGCRAVKFAIHFGATMAQAVAAC
jgi:hypothetical protein